jgi:hypothetical protein
MSPSAHRAVRAAAVGEFKQPGFNFTLQAKL